MEYLKWSLNKNENKGYATNKNLVENYINSDASELMDKYTQIDENGVLYILNSIIDSKNIFQGIGVDLGGGISLISSVLEKNFPIKNIFCVEIVEEAIKYCHKKIQKFILGKPSEKIISVNGSFDHMEIDTNSVDFIISWDSLHHSDNLKNTLQECYRVLKNNSFLVVVDKVHNNSTPDVEIDRMLNFQYDKEFLKNNFLDENLILKRSDEGEHEYRFFEWENFFKESNFKIIQNYLVKTNTENNLQNDNNLNEILVEFNVGGFQQQKVIYVLKKV